MSNEILWQSVWILLSFLLGWVLAFQFSKSSTSHFIKELSKWKQKYIDLESKYNSIVTSQVLVKSVVKPPELLHINTVTKRDSFKKLKDTQLQIIEGIGPKIQKILRENEINTWKELAGLKPLELRKILDSNKHNRLKIIDPSTWSDQAQLAVDGRWHELIALQKTLNAGKTNAINETNSKLELILTKMGLIKKWEKDDLKVIEGIGPNIEELLHHAGIKTWDDLADTNLDTLQNLLHDAGTKYKLADPSTWSTQAELAAEGRWVELQTYQDMLNGGK